MLAALEVLDQKVLSAISRNFCLQKYWIKLIYLLLCIISVEA